MRHSQFIQILPPIHKKCKGTIELSLNAPFYITLNTPTIHIEFKATLYIFVLLLLTYQ